MNAPQPHKSALKRPKRPHKRIKPHTPTATMQKQKQAHSNDFSALLNDLSTKDRKALQAHLLLNIPYFRRGDQKIRYVTAKRKIYFWSRLRGLDHPHALRQAHLCRETTYKRLTESNATKALLTTYKTDGVTLEYLLDRLVSLVESGVNENSKVRALKLLSELKGFYTTRSVVDINEHMKISISIPAPALCPHCGNNTYELPVNTTKILEQEFVPAES